jgi:ubiquinone/menaquinone biosynthesis C-methylase UbiE
MDGEQGDFWNFFKRERIPMTTQQSGDDVRAFWNRQAGLGLWAGSRDVVAKQIEMATIARHINDGLDVVDIGCGNGITALELAKRFKIRVTGFDYAVSMVEEARRIAASMPLVGTVSFEAGDVTQLTDAIGRYDVAYTERVLINLPDWPTQARAIESIIGILRPGGRYLMCENSQCGLDRLNGARKLVDLDPIVPPWHNRYLRDQEVADLKIQGAVLEAVEDYSSTYYFISRVLNAALARNANREPEYESELNLLAPHLPAFGNLGQGRLWVWRRVSA